MHKRKIVIEGTVAKIELTREKWATIDSEDVPLVSRYSWCYHLKGYACASVNGKIMQLHRFLLNCTDRDQVVDHINGDSLDCRRSNLRVVSQAINCRNKSKIESKSGYRGLKYKNKKKPWRLHPGIGNKQISLGYYSDPKLPATLFDCIQNLIADTLEVHVSPRSLNFPESDYSDYQSVLNQHLSDSQLDRLYQAVDRLASRSKCSKTCVYLAQRSDGAIKIGVSRSPEHRVQAIRYGHCLGSCPNTKLIYTHIYPSADTAYERERELHSLFAEYHIEGEWFKPEIIEQIFTHL